MWNEIKSKLGLNKESSPEGAPSQEKWQKPAGENRQPNTPLMSKTATADRNVLARGRHNWHADPSSLIEASLTEAEVHQKRMYPEDVAVPTKTKVTYSRLAAYVNTLSQEDREAALTDLKTHR